MILQNKSLSYILFICLAFLYLNTISTSEQQLTLDGNKTASFNGLFSDFGTDTNLNELYDYITIKIGINVFTPGEYMARGSLYDISGNEIISSTNKAFLKSGIRFVVLEFYGSKRSGPYHLKNLALYDAYGIVIDYVSEAYITKKDYYYLEYLTRAKLNGNYTDRGTDVNGDGQYDFLTVDVGVDVKAPGEYGLTGDLYDLNINKRKVIWSIDHGNLSKGNRTMHLNFNGKSLKNHRMNGSFYLENVTLFSGSSSTGLKICDYLRRAYITSVFKYTDFSD